MTDQVQLVIFFPGQGLLLHLTTVIFLYSISIIHNKFIEYEFIINNYNYITVAFVIILSSRLVVVVVVVVAAAAAAVVVVWRVTSA